MAGREWMRTLCRLGKEKLCLPFSVEIDGKSWDCATNGHALLFIEGATFQKRGSAPSAHTLMHAVRRTETRYGVAPFGQLLDFCFSAFVACEHCGGTAERYDEEDGDVPCPDCDGRGYPERQPGRILGVYCDRMLLGRYLLPLRTTTLAVLVRAGGELEAIELRCPDDSWRLYVMPMRRTLNDAEPERAEAPVTLQDPI